MNPLFPGYPNMASMAKMPFYNPNLPFMQPPPMMPHPNLMNSHALMFMTQQQQEVQLQMQAMMMNYHRMGLNHPLKPSLYKTEYSHSQNYLPKEEAFIDLSSSSASTSDVEDTSNPVKMESGLEINHMVTKRIKTEEKAPLEVKPRTIPKTKLEPKNDITVKKEAIKPAQTTLNIKQEAVAKVTKPAVSANKAQRAQLSEMIKYLLQHIERISPQELYKAREKYTHNPNLLPIFDVLVEKCSSVKKHREDIVRYIIRRAFKYLKSYVLKHEKVYGKKAYALLCKKYFDMNIKELEREGVDISDEKELIDFLLPYRQNSKNRTMNVSFTAEIFSSIEFRKDYKIFLDHFEGIMNGDNNVKTAKLVNMAEDCIKKGNVDRIRKCSRLPWIKYWVDRTRCMAAELLDNGFNKDKNNYKKILLMSPSLVQNDTMEDADTKIEEKLPEKCLKI